jgi:hypothetical protein
VGPNGVRLSQDYQTHSKHKASWEKIWPKPKYQGCLTLVLNVLKAGKIRFFQVFMIGTLNINVKQE